MTTAVPMTFTFASSDIRTMCANTSTNKLNKYGALTKGTSTQINTFPKNPNLTAVHDQDFTFYYYFFPEDTIPATKKVPMLSIDIDTMSIDDGNLSISSDDATTSDSDTMNMSVSISEDTTSYTASIILSDSDTASDTASDTTSNFSAEDMDDQLALILNRMANDMDEELDCMQEINPSYVGRITSLFHHIEKGRVNNVNRSLAEAENELRTGGYTWLSQHVIHNALALAVSSRKVGVLQVLLDHMSRLEETNMYDDMEMMYCPVSCTHLDDAPEIFDILYYNFMNICETRSAFAERCMMECGLVW